MTSLLVATMASGCFKSAKAETDGGASTANPALRRQVAAEIASLLEMLTNSAAMQFNSGAFNNNSLQYEVQPFVEQFATIIAANDAFLTTGEKNG